MPKSILRHFHFDTFYESEKGWNIFHISLNFYSNEETLATLKQLFFRDRIQFKIEFEAAIREIRKLLPTISEMSEGDENKSLRLHQRGGEL